MEKHIRAARGMTNFLEGKYKIFGLRFGADALIGVIPGIGDIIPMLLSFYLIWIAIRMELPARKVGQMITNICIDFVIGSVPVLGDFADFIFKANIKNLALLEEHITGKPLEGRVIPE